MKRITLFLLGIILFVSFFAFKEPNDKYFAILKNLDIFATLYKEVNTYYVDEVNPTTLIETGIVSMLKSLDPYTNYIPEEQIENYRTMTTGEYAGIGATVLNRNKKATIVMPFEGYIAHRSGVKIGDEILKIDGKDITEKNSSEISTFLKGQAGTPISLTIKRLGNEKLLELQLIREKITIPNVPYFGMVTEDVGLIALTDFTNNASKEVKDALNQLKEKGAKNIILDLRGNPGGLLSEAINISNIFIPKGSEVVSTKGKVKEWNKQYLALNSAVDTDIPLIVLTNSNSASAAEIVTGVIQDYDRGLIVGQNSYGKGLVQATRSLTYNSKLKVTVAKYYIPSGRCIQALDYSHRNPDGSVGKTPDSLRVPFKTKNGRIVYDGGGVKPDVEVGKVSNAPIVNSLENKGFLFDYAVYYASKNPNVKSAKEFEMTEVEYQDFVKWLLGKDYDYDTKVEQTIVQLENSAKEEKYYEDIKSQIQSLKTKVMHNKEADLQKFKPEIKEMIEKEIVAHYFLERGTIEATFDDDLEIKAALELFKDKTRFQKILARR